MWITVFILGISAAGCLCDEYECYMRENNCSMNTVPGEVPDTVEDLKTACQDIQELGACSIEAKERCGYSEDAVAEQRKDMDYLKEVCKDENPIFNVISSNLGCIKSASKEFDEICRIKIRNTSTISNFVDNLTQEEDDASVICLYTLIDVTCPAIVAGHRCDNDQVRDSINALLGYVRKLESACPEEAREKLDPIYDAYKSVVLESLRLKDELEDRK